MASDLHRPATPRRRSSLRVLPWMLALAVLSAAPATAQPARPGPSAADKETARALMDEGRAKERAGDDRGALRAYLAADRIMGVPSTGLSVGKVRARLGELVEARDVLLRVTRYPRLPHEPMPFALARAQAAALAAQLAPRIPSLQIEVVGVAAGTPVTILVDGATVQREVAALARKVNPGVRQVVVSAPGYRDSRQAINLAQGAHRVVRVGLQPGSNEGSDTRAAGISPWVWVGFGVGGTGIVVGAVSGALASSKSSELDDACPQKICPPSRQSDIDAMMVLAHTSTISFVVGSLGVGLGLFSLLALSDMGSEGGARTSVVSLSAGAGSLAVTGRF